MPHSHKTGASGPDSITNPLVPDPCKPESPAPESSGWIAGFIQKFGRSPRILHIGNIANNAYQTAKMLNAAGADCDVLCPDYYHIMGNPEWDDADFEGDAGNPFFPAFHKLDLHGFQRPRWFSQGPRRPAIAYLLAKRRGNASEASRLWHKLERARRCVIEKEDMSAVPFTVAIPGHLEKVFRAVLKVFLSIYHTLHSRFSYLCAILKELFTKPAVFVKRVRQKLGLLSDEELQALLAYNEAMRVRSIQARREEAVDKTVLERVMRDAKAYFPDREMLFGPLADYYIHSAMEFKALFACYDIIQGYATEAVWPYLCGCKNYVAWEHGTLRTAPYEDNDRARLLLLAYAAAGAVYVTNVDCYDSAVYITKHSGAPIVCGLHGFDTERMLQKQAAALQIGAETPHFAAPGETLFFCPARVDIDPHYGTYLKQNDLLYRTLARLYQNQGGFKVLQLEWGSNTDDLKRFIAEECGALAGAVVWQKPFGKATFYRLLGQAALVFDNFLLPLMGGNGIETLMSGHAALVNKRIPDELMLRFFPEIWPIFPVDGEDELYAAAKMALDDPAACLALAQKGREWILKYHSHARIVAKNCQAYNHVIPLLHTSEE